MKYQMIDIRFLKYILASGAIALGVHAADAQGQFSDIVRRIAADAPSYSAEQARLQANVESMRAENVLENPEVEFERLWSAGPADNKWSGSLSQAFDWPGAYGARSCAAAALATAGRLELDETFRQLQVKAAENTLQLLAARRKVEILTEVHESMTRLRQEYDRAWQMGETTILDVNKMKIEEIRSATELEQARAEMNAVKADLISMAPNSAAVEDAMELVDFPYVELASAGDYTAAVENAPELRYYSAIAEAENANVAVAKAQRLPGFSLGYVHAFEEGTHFNGLSVGVSLPVYSRRHAVAAADQLGLAARLDLVARRVELETQIAADYASATSLKEQIARFSPLVEGVNNMALLRKALDGGELSLLDYLQETNYFLRARLDCLALLRDYTLLAFRLNSYTAPAM